MPTDNFYRQIPEDRIEFLQSKVAGNMKGVGNHETYLANYQNFLNKQVMWDRKRVVRKKARWEIGHYISIVEQMNDLNGPIQGIDATPAERLRAQKIHE
jgi:hypothetical protein